MQRRLELLKFGVLDSSILKNGNSWVSTLPEFEEVLIARSPVRMVSRRLVCPGNSQLCDSADWKIPDQTAVIRKFLKFCQRRWTLIQLQKGLTSQISRIAQSAHFYLWIWIPEFIRNRLIENADRTLAIATINFNGSANRRQPVIVEDGVQRKAAAKFVRDAYCRHGVAGASQRQCRENIHVAGGSHA